MKMHGYYQLKCLAVSCRKIDIVWIVEWIAAPNLRQLRSLNVTI